MDQGKSTQNSGTRFAAPMIFAVSFGVVCAGTSLALMHWGPPAIADLAGRLNIIPFFLLPWVAWLISVPQGTGIILFFFTIFLQWCVIAMMLYGVYWLAATVVRGVFGR